MRKVGFPEFAAELIRLRVDLIIVSTTPTAIAAKHATQTIPIVIPTAIDPVGAGLVASLARPGGNVTGLSEINKDVVPGLSRVVVLWNATNPANASVWQETQAAARALGLRLHSQDVRDPQDFEGAFALTAQARPDALLVLGMRSSVCTANESRSLPRSTGSQRCMGGGSMWRRAA